MIFEIVAKKADVDSALMIMSVLYRLNCNYGATSYAKLITQFAERKNKKAGNISLFTIFIWYASMLFT